MNTTIWAVLIILGIIGKFINMIIRKSKKSRITFDEFDDIEKIKKQELNEKREMEYEATVLDKVYSDSYSSSIINAIDKKEYNETKGEYYGLTGFDMIKAHLDAQENVKEAKRDLYNFKVLDSVEVEEDITEGNQISVLRKNGNTFDVELFKKWSRQIFGCIKLGAEEQLEVVKNFMSEQLYDRLKYQTKQFAKDGLEFVTEDLIIDKCKLYEYSRSMSKEEIKILISATMKEYIIQKSTNKILRGNKKKSYNKKIIMTFLKQNIAGNEGIIHNCPNCGAEIVQTEFGKCRYCNTLVVPIRYNWTLIKFETL